jgi:hypothetical protein
VATANTGYAFSNWTENGSVVSTNASYSFTVSGARTLVANFVAKTGLSEVETYGIKVYSANNKAIVEGADGWDVSVVDLSGRTIFIKRSDSDKFEIGIPVPGLYLIRLPNDGKICSEKVIIR